MTGAYLTFQAAEVVCGECGKRQTFSERGGGGPDTLARQAGWLLQWPGPHVLCPVHTPNGVAYRAALKPTPSAESASAAANPKGTENLNV